MNSFFAVKFFGEAFITLLVITDPPGVVPPFIGLTRGLPGQVRARLAWQAAVVALGVILAFAVFGQTVLAYLGIEVAALQGAGGLLLLLVALQLLTGQLEEPTEADRAKTNVAFVPLGTPLLAGPGAIVATMCTAELPGGMPWMRGSTWCRPPGAAATPGWSGTATRSSWWIRAPTPAPCWPPWRSGRSWP